MSRIRHVRTWRETRQVLVLVVTVALGVALAVGAAVSYAGDVPTPTDAGIVPVAAGPSSTAQPGPVSTGAGAGRAKAVVGESSMMSRTPLRSANSVAETDLATGSSATRAAPERSAVPPTRTTAASVGGVRPAVLTLPSLGVSAAVQPVDSLDGVLTVPSDPSQVGWWAASATAGSSRGSTVIDGHIDSAVLGIGALFRLAELGPGDPVEVRTVRGNVVQYVVSARRVYQKSRGLPEEVFDQQVSSRLVLISCGGPFDRAARSYLDNIVIYAALVR